ncbi:MAG: hypothetical protein PHZ26_02525 [Candidatus Gracilibacteria bacterium]|nr:hypothetical protein [Candidatus Gracilibacteria bacterium]MDD2908608.1 hypothetical protein [Candidatus Gracilibacteria bacterium]
MKFSIGYNEELDFLSLVNKYKDNISTIYFPMFYKVAYSGRTILDRTKTIREYYNKVMTLICLCKKYGIETDLILNSACDGINTCNDLYRKNIINHIKPLQRCGLTTITLTNLWYIDLIKNEFPGLNIANSLNLGGIRKLEEAIDLKNLGVNILIVDPSINYDLKLLKSIKEKTKLKMKILINESCISNCPFDRQHANMLAHLVEPESNEWIKSTCGQIYNKNRRKFFRVPFIRPEDLKNYDFIDYLKLNTRDNNTDYIDKLLSIYIKQDFEGNLLDLLEFDFSEVTSIKYIDNKKLGKLGFFEDMLKCPKDCDTCTKCDKYF